MVSEEDFEEPDEPPEPDELLDDDDDDDDVDKDEDEGDDMVLDDSSDDEEFVEFDPSGRYGRYSEVLGKGAMKTVYRAYDMTDCKEVAWNKARPPIECSDEQAVAVQREIHILQGLHHQAIIKLYSAWVDDTNGDTNFITELCCTTLLEYRLKHKHISRKAVKSWGRQILKGLAHLHMQDPPIIHRDLKCENIFVKCRSNTALKIGDLGSATFLDETHHMHTLVGTPEFMAPEMFQEDYNELVDVYSFGMCMLELLTRECPYSECKSLGQIYKKVINGEKPKALDKVTDMQALRLINRCLLPACQRPSASELLADPFLECHEGHTSSGESMKASASMPNLKVPTTNIGVKNMLSGQGVKLARPYAAYRNVDHIESVDRDLLLAKKATDHGRGKALCTKSPSFRRTYRVMGRVDDQYTLRLKIRIQESSRSCDIDFPFDLRSDSPISVAEEMVRTLDYSDSDLATIAGLIREEIGALMPNMQARYPMHASAMNLMLEHCQSNESIDRGSSSGQSSCFISCTSGELDFYADKMRDDGSSKRPLSCEGYIESAQEKACRISSDDGNRFEYSSLSANGKSTITSFTSGADACNEPPCENVELGQSVFLESDSVREEKEKNSFACCGTEQATFVSKEVTKNVLLDCPCTLSANWNGCNTSGNNTDVPHTNAVLDASGVISEECDSFRRKNRSVSLFGSRQICASNPHSSSRSSSRFKQLPAGMGILLRPSTEQGLRRALPSCVNAFA